MSTSDLRDAFNAIALPQGVRCTAARLSYCDSVGTSGGKRDHQVIAFDIVRSADNSAETVTTEPIPPGASMITAMQNVMRKVLGTK